MVKAYVLVVDDDKGILETFKTILEQNGYKVDTAQNGREAIEKNKKEPLRCCPLRYKIARHGRN